MATEANAVVVDPATALYVGDLDGGVTEEQLKLLFDQIGEVSSVRICFDQITERSLGYGYVNYISPQHAAKALELLNFTPLNGKPIRVAFSNREGSLRKSGLGNIFVKNLDKSINHKALYHIFSPFGNIISSKVETDYYGISKGYGYVHYEHEEYARNAIEHLNGVLFHGMKLYVGPFVSKQERELSIDKTKFTNVFVRNMSESTTDEDLKSIFNEFGPISSAAVMRDEAGNSKCFGFVNFENAEGAAKSVEVLNGRIFNGKEWYVGRAQKKSERERELKSRHDQIVNEARERSLGMNNLYIKNIDEKIDTDELKELFSPFGIIQSCKVMFDSRGISKGYGFVEFSTVQEASKAISEMNGKMVGSKPLYVGIAERKEVRQQRLQSLFSNLRATTMSPPVSPRTPVYSPGGSGIGQQMFYGHGGPIFPPLPGFGYQQQLLPGMIPSGPLMPNILFPPLQRGPPYGAPLGNSFQQRSQQLVPLTHHQQPDPFRLHAHRPPPQRPSPSMTVGQGTRIHRSVPVGTMASGLANASPTQQRTMLGENLYPLVEQLEPEMAAKVTGMLLEMDQTEVLHLLESPQSLRAKVMEAMEVLRNAPSTSEEITTLSLNE